MIFFSDQVDDKGEHIPDINRAKGVPKSVSKQFTASNFQTSHSHTTAIYNNVNISLSSEILYFGVLPHMRKTYTFKVKKRVLNPFSRKRFILCDSFDSLAIGHFRIDELRKSNI